MRFGFGSTRSFRASAAAAACLAMVLAGLPAAAVSEAPRRSASFNGEVHAVLYHGSRVYVGGDFTSASDSSGTVQRSHVAAMDVRTGQLLPWNPRTNGSVRAIAASGARVYLGGTFTRVGAARRARIAAVTAEGRGRVATTFRHRTNGVVNTLAARGRQLFLGGDFTEVDGRARKRLASFNLRTGSLRRWHPSADAPVLALAVGSTRVYVAGSFWKLNRRGEDAYLAAVSRGTGRTVAAFSPAVSYPILDIDLYRRALYIAGDGRGGRLRKLSLGGSNRWTIITNGAVQALDVLGTRVYAGGHFTTVCQTNRLRPNNECRDGARTRSKLFASTTAGRTTAWSPDCNSAAGVRSIDVHHRRGLVGLGGAFTTFENGASPQRFAQFG